MMYLTGYAISARRDRQRRRVPPSVLYAGKDCLMRKFEGQLLVEHKAPPDGVVVGRIVKTNVDEIGLRVVARVNDPKIVAQIEDGSLHSFSVGAEYWKTDGRFTRFDIHEVSLTGSPSGRGCKFKIWRGSDAPQI